MSKLTAAMLYGQVIGIASTALMLFVFFNESFLGHGVFLYEPNRALATFELYMAFFGILVQIIVILGTARKEGKKMAGELQPDGFPKSDRAYA